MSLPLLFKMLSVSFKLVLNTIFLNLFKKIYDFPNISKKFFVFVFLMCGIPKDV